MAKTWNEVRNSDAFKKLSYEDKEQARQQYFAQVIAPQVPEQDRDTVRDKFDADTRRFTMSPEELKADKEARYQAQQKEMVDELPWYQKGAIGMGKAFVDTARGVGQLVGKVTPEDVARSRSQDQAIMSTGAGKVGNTLGYVAESIPVGMAGAPAALGGRIALGAAIGSGQGFLQPHVSGREQAKNTLVGGALGGVIPAVGAGLGTLAKNALTGLATPEARALMQKGVKLTPGQMVGGVGEKLEDAATSIPFLGSAIQNARNRSVETFNTATINRALSSLKQSLPDSLPARQAVDEANDIVSKAYKNILGKMTGTIDKDFAQAIGSTWNKYKGLPAKEASELDTYLTQKVLGKFDKNGMASGKEVKRVMSDLGAQAAKLRRSDDLYRRELGEALRDIRGHMKDMLKRVNPGKQAADLEKADQAYRQMVRVNRASGSLGADEGLFTPAQLKNSVRATDSTRNKAAFRSGTAEMQDLAEAGQKVLPSKIADSGTATRLMHATPQGLMAGIATSPLTALYSSPGMSVMRAMLAPKDSPTRNYIANMLQQRFAAPANAMAAPAVMPQQHPMNIDIYGSQAPPPVKSQ